MKPCLLVDFLRTASAFDPGFLLTTSRDLLPECRLRRSSEGTGLPEPEPEPGGEPQPREPRARAVEKRPVAAGGGDELFKRAQPRRPGDFCGFARKRFWMMFWVRFQCPRLRRDMTVLRTVARQDTRRFREEADGQRGGRWCQEDGAQFGGPGPQAAARVTCSRLLPLRAQPHRNFSDPGRSPGGFRSGFSFCSQGRTLLGPSLSHQCGSLVSR